MSNPSEVKEREELEAYIDEFDCLVDSGELDAIDTCKARRVSHWLSELLELKEKRHMCPICGESGGTTPGVDTCE